MKISIPKIVRPLRLAEYAPEYGEAVVWVHANPSRGKLRELLEARRALAALTPALSQGPSPLAPLPEGEGEGEIEAHLREVDGLMKRIVAWLAENWSQGEAAETHWSVEEVEQVLEHAADSDPGLWPFLVGGTLDVILDYREMAKNGARPPSGS
ncbi:MAG: hypothetical protein C4570_03430 [Ammonifex sp.]|jgi:hypothetical protein|nr:MAG: hypothetical protein C4570_03430 [Ammonifex sp.]